VNESKKQGRGEETWNSTPFSCRCAAPKASRGYWLDRTINDDLDARLAHCPDKLALTAVRRESGEVRRFTYRELAKLADRIAVGLARLGVGRNDVVAMQLPNWW
jgi:cyclohexanecarboxylate-CoA ligase